MNYLTIEHQAEGRYTEKMSRFLAFAVPVASREEARTEIQKYQNKYHDARHVCWAYMLGASRNDFLSNDNGEPSGTAGKPILGQINSFGLTDILIVVVRYFGGIKLGTSGLIAAYREASRQALESARIIERCETGMVSFTFPYLSMNDVMRLVKDTDVKIISQIFDNLCNMSVNMPLDNMEAFKHRLSGIAGISME